MSESDLKLLHTVERHYFQDELRHRKTRQGRFDASMWHLDHPIPGTDRLLAPSDYGQGAAAIYAALDPAPRWMHLWMLAYSKLPPKGKKILNALKQDWRSRPAAKIAGVSQPTIDRWKTFFKMHFDQCHSAWKRDFRG